MIERSRVLAWVGLVMSAMGACAESEDAPPSGTRGLRFTAMEQSGIVLENVSGGPDKMVITESVGQGAAVLDYDGDGRLDVFVANGDVFEPTSPRAEPRSALYRNLGDFRFRDVTDEAGLTFRAWSHGAWRVDFDGDLRPDLYVTVFGGPNRFFRNVGGRFVDASAIWGGADPGPSTAAVFFDADADGDLDLYVGNYVDYDPRDPPNAGRPCEWRGLQVFCGPRGTKPSADTFWENRDGRLEQVTAGFGFADVPASYTLGAVSGDFDDDGDADLYVANDSEANYYFENLSPARFRELGVRYGVDRNQDGRAQAGMGVDAGDVDGDGRLDLFVTNFSHDSNTLYRNIALSGGGFVFDDVTFGAGLGMESYRYLSWGTCLSDFDRDGWLDILIASGHVYPQLRGVAAGTTYEQPNQLLLNLGSAGAPLRFEPFEPAPGDALSFAATSRGLAVADLDDDGDADFVVVEQDAPPTVVRNDSRTVGHWIGFSLRGAARNTQAVGARLWVEDASGVVRLRERTGGGSYLSSGDPRVLVGLGAAAGPVKATVRWPGGAVTVHGELEPDRYHRLHP